MKVILIKLIKHDNGVAIINKIESDKEKAYLLDVYRKDEEGLRSSLFNVNKLNKEDKMREQCFRIAERTLEFTQDKLKGYE